MDKLATINQKIGLVLANTNFNDSIFYYFETCEYITTSIVYKDLAFCTLFGINEQSGVITTNSSNYESFQKNSFYLKVIAAYKDDILAKNSVEIRVFIVNPQEKARFVFARAPLQNINDFFRDLRKYFFQHSAMKHHFFQLTDSIQQTLCFYFFFQVN